MYTKYFGLTEEPFSIAANPRFLYMSTRHREALAHLLYGIRSDSGFVLLTGEVGTGKTTVCRCLLEQIPENTKVAFILNPKVSVIELLSSICDELGIACLGRDRSVKTFVDAINRHLLKYHAEGRNTVVIIDEAQNLSVDVLEQLRLLTNLETNERKLMRIILLGQPELETMLSRPELRQVEQRITARYHLQPLLRSEINTYVLHRLAVAGRREPVFSARVLDKLYSKTRGIPRLINVICDRAMLGAYVKSRRRVNGPILNKAAREVQGLSYKRRWLLWGSITASALLVTATAVVALLYVNGKEITMMLPQRSLELLPGIFVESSVAESSVVEPSVAEPSVVEPSVAEPSVAEPSVAESPVAESPVAESPVVEPSVLEPSVVELPVAVKPEASLQWPDEAVARDDSLAAAYLAQFTQWNIPLTTDNVDPCTQAISLGLRCFWGVGNLGGLISTNRPAILALVDNDGRRFHATLLALEGDLATVAFAHGIEKVALQDLEAHWQGHYQLLWRASPDGYTIVKPGSRGPVVVWLTEYLLDAGVKSVQVHDAYDEDVIAAVRGFQRNHGLVADGIAGRQTLIQLNSVNDKSIPRLSNRRGS